MSMSRSAFRNLWKFPKTRQSGLIILKIGEQSKAVSSIKGSDRGELRDKYSGEEIPAY